MDNYIPIDKKIFLQEYTYKDKENFLKFYDKSKEPNYGAMLVVWNRGIRIYIIYKKILFFTLNVGFLSMIDCSKLSNKERDMLQYIDVPRKFNGLFVNDMRIGVPFRRKGIGSKVIEKILVEKNIYALDPVEDGQHFWKKYSFEYNKNGKLAVLDNR